MNKKIVELEELAKIVDEQKGKGKKVVLCHGVFDLLHIGHIRHFGAAKKFGNVLVVTVTPDRYVKKGPHRPVFTEKLRAEAIASLECVDYVAINKWPTATETIKLLKTNFYAKGSDYSNPQDDFTKGIIEEKDAIYSVGGELIFTDEITFSSSTLINKYLHIFPKGTEEFLTNFSERYSEQDIINHMEKLYDLKVLVIGEAVIDEYAYGTPIGKAGKEPIIALKYQNTEQFAGGALAIANHVANFCNNVGIFSLLGDTDSQEEFISEHLNKKITKLFHYKKNSPTIVKRRFIDSAASPEVGKPLKKMFELYIINDNYLESEQTQELISELKKLIPNYDLTLVADFGHGMIGNEMVDLITKKSNFIAVNTQTNAGNMGYNTISKYPKADYICITEGELRLDCRDKTSDLSALISRVSDKLSCKNIAVTTGIKGCAVSSGKEVIRIPALSEKVIDTMGAGDAFLSITAPLVASKVPMEAVGFIGNAVGALKCATVGHRESVEKVALYKYITSVLK